MKCLKLILTLNRQMREDEIEAVEIETLENLLRFEINFTNRY